MIGLLVNYFLPDVLASLVGFIVSFRIALRPLRRTNEAAPSLSSMKMKEKRAIIFLET